MNNLTITDLPLLILNAYQVDAMHEKTDLEYSSLSSEAERHYRNGDYDQAFEKYLELGEKGYEEVQAFLGWMYLMGKGTHVDIEEAKKWYKQAAMRGDSDAQRCLARIFTREKKLEDAIKWFEKLASQGDSDAQWNLGLIASHQKDFQTAISWYEKSAELGYAPGLYRLATHYHYGKGVEEDKQRAFILLEEAAKKENVKAQIEYSKRLMLGYGGIGKIFKGFVLFFSVPFYILRIGYKNWDDDRLVR